MKRLFFHAVMAWLATIALTQSGVAQTTRSQHTFSNSNGHAYLYVDDDSSTRPVQTIIVYKDGPLYNIVMAGEKVLSMTVNGRPVPADSLRVYDPLIGKLIVQIKEDREQAKRDMQQASRDWDQAVRDKLQAERDMLQAMQAKRQTELEQTKMLQDKLQAERDREQAMQDQMQAQRDLLQAKRDREQIDLDRVQAERDRQQAMLDRKQAEQDRQIAEEDRAKLKALIKEAVKDGLAQSEEDVRSVLLDDDNFILNGKVQSEELHKKYSSLFLRPNGQISFRRNR